MLSFFLSVLHLNVPSHACIYPSCAHNHNQAWNVWLWRMLCPKYMCLLAASDPLMLSPAVIFSGGQLLACRVCTEIYPHEGLVHVHSHARYVRVSSFSSCSSCSKAYAMSLESTFYFWRAVRFFCAIGLPCYYFLSRKKSLSTNHFSTLQWRRGNYAGLLIF